MALRGNGGVMKAGGLVENGGVRLTWSTSHDRDVLKDFLRVFLDATDASKVSQARLYRGGIA